MTMTRLSLALLLSLSLAACGGAPDQLPAPAPDGGPGTAPQAPSPCAPGPVLLTATSAAPSIVGGTYLDGTFKTQRTIDECLDATIPGRPSSCASWTILLPQAPAGLTREITLDSPIREVSGEAAAWPGCDEHLGVDLWTADNVFNYLRFLSAGPLRVVDGVSSITVAVCARGAAALKLAPPTGTLRFLPPQ